MLTELTTERICTSPVPTGLLAEAVMKHLPPGSPVPAYLRRLLLAGGDSGRELFRRLYQGSQSALEAMSQAGLAAPGRGSCGARGDLAVQ